MLWYNNDGLVVFPEILVGIGYPWSPGEMSGFLSVATEVSGPSDAWGELNFNQPVVPSLEGLYLVFELPADQTLVKRGASGGAGVGYTSQGWGLPGWLSGEGEAWARLHSDLEFAVEPILIPVGEGMVVKSLGGDEVAPEEGKQSSYLWAGPNPFNPQTEVFFGLPRGGKTTLEIFAIRGRRVAQPVHGHLAGGEHTAVWDGRDLSGRKVASGVYFLRLNGPGLELKKKILLVK